MAYLSKFQENQVIIKEGEITNRLHMVKTGAVVLYINYEKENENVLGICGPNKSFGETGVLLGQASPYTAVAYSDAEIIRFSAGELGSFMRSYPQQTLGILKSLSRVNQLLKLNCDLLLEEISKYKEIIDTLSNENTEINIKNKRVMENHAKNYDVTKAYMKIMDEKAEIDKQMAKASLGFGLKGVFNGCSFLEGKQS